MQTFTILAAVLAAATANPFAHYGFGSYKGLVNYGIPTAHSYTFSRKTPTVLAAPAVAVAAPMVHSYAAAPIVSSYAHTGFAAPAIAYNGLYNGVYNAGLYGKALY